MPSRASNDYDDDISASSASVEEIEEEESSSSDDSSSSEESGFKDEEVEEISAEDPCDDYWRRAVFVGLLLIGITAVFSTFIPILGQENDQFSAAFDDFVDNLKDAATIQDLSTGKAIQSLSDSITVQAVWEGSKWPFVLVPFFDAQGAAAKAITASGAAAIMMSPLVTEAQKDPWGEYSVLVGDQLSSDPSFIPSTIPPTIYKVENTLNGTTSPSTDVGPGHYSPVWQTYPPLKNGSVVNFDMFSNLQLKKLYHAMNDTREAVISPVMSLSPISDAIGVEEQVSSVIFAPVFEERDPLSNTTLIAANLALVISWESYLSFVGKHQMDGTSYVLQNTCGQTFSAEYNDGNLTNFVFGAEYNLVYAHMVGVIPLMGFLTAHFNSTVGTQACAYELYVYPTQEMRDAFKSDTAVIATSVVAACFVAVLLIFYLVERRFQTKNDRIIKSVEKSNAIIASLFPSNVRDRLFGGGDDNASRTSRGTSRSRKSFGGRLRNYLTEGEKADDGGSQSAPIADLFPECTVLFADIVGFTAWSSMREPAQVFTLLETLYSAFDELANELGVFKVETIGDCYVAVTGLPDPREDHAVVMAIFARECLKKMQVLAKELEVKLGPDTGDLSMRFGLHSGPVTAGVLRGERSRFQLFGDTVNTAARIESTGQRGRIHLSQECADLIMAAQKAHWVEPREDKVTAKGKGELTTFWLGGTGTASVSSAGNSHLVGMHVGKTVGDSAMQPLPKIMRPRKVEKPVQSETASKTARLVDWNVDIMQRLLRQIEARRAAQTERAQKEKQSTQARPGSGDFATKSMEPVGKQYCEPIETPHSEDPNIIYTEEVKEIISLPEFDSKAARKIENAESVVLSGDVVDQLHGFVSTISRLYNENSFHNFEHASHVTMSVVKLLSRIVAPDIDYPEESAVYSERKQNQMLAARIHDHTYGITSDPLTQFAVVFSALIHDVDHVGIPNNQLCVEQPELAKRFREQSVAEQHSVAVSWDLLMLPKYEQLRRAIYNSDTERDRFLQLVVNCVMATDIVNPELKKLRNARWDKAFTMKDNATAADRNRKGTIVIEHLIQASDVSHTMQHWHIYRKWNERLFIEMYSAFREGRSRKNPAEFWAKGEVGFFDFYIIPLAKKLKECGVFGVSSDEYLQYAVKNRNEWETKGQKVVDSMVEKIELGYQ